MKKQTTLVGLLLLFNLFTKGQKVVAKDNVYIDTVNSPYIIDDTPVGLGLLIGNNQRFNKNHHPEILTSPSTIISVQKNKKGEIYVKAFVNSDFINIIASRLNNKNYKNYRAFMQLSSSGKIEKGRNLEHQINLIASEHNPIILAHNNLNRDKTNFYDCSFVYHIKDKSDSIISTLILEFVFPKPEPQILSINEKLISDYKSRPGETYFFLPATITDFKKQISSANLVATKFDSFTNIPQKLVLPSTKNSLFLSFKNLGSGVDNYLEYKLNSDSTWKTTHKGEYPVILLNDLAIGKYKLQVRYPKQKDFVFEYDFEIKPVWTQTTSFKVFIGSFITAFSCFILFVIHYKRQKAKLKQEFNKRKELQNQITSFRSQLHPHFIFNALNSIQGLVNKNDIENANLYISKFGSLLHDILEKSDKTMHPLAHEIRQIEYYLQLEQLRFKFQYKINVDEGINISEIDIPAMLLQPFVENAIKHGIAEKGEEGLIKLNFKKKETELIISIIDNGKGYDTSKNKSGHGNTLIKERLNALNQFLKAQQIILELNSAINEGTTVNIFFTNWLYS